MKPKTEKFLYRLPRILNILFLLFLAMFSLDIFDGNYGFWGTVLGLFMHNIPVLILTGVLILSWRRPLISAILFPLIGLSYITLVFISCRCGMAVNPLPLIAIILGVLYWVSWKREKLHPEVKN